MEDAIYPSTYGLIQYHFNEEGILCISIFSGANKPYYLKEKGPKPSGVYKRVGSSTRKATEEEILNMIMSSKKYIYEDDISEDQNLTFQYLSHIFTQRNIAFTD